jgi:protein-S-isoprenylcysteine O-methyltransferase Ste14
MKKFTLSLIAILGVLFVSAQDAATAAVPQEGMNSNGKIWVVMTVCLTILSGLIIYVASLDRKLGRMEKK